MTSLQQDHRYRFRSPVLHALAMATLYAALPTVVQAQVKPAPPGPASLSAPPTQLVDGKAPKARTIVLTPSRPGAYSYWTVGRDATQGAVSSFPSGDIKANVTVGGNDTTLFVLDETTGTIASYPLAKIADGAPLRVAADDFRMVRSVGVKITATEGKPVEKASVTLKDSKGKTQSRVLTAADGGVARFENVALGRASVTAQYGADGPKATQEVTVAPVKGGGPVELTVGLSGNVPTLTSTAAPATNSSSPSSTDTGSREQEDNAPSAANNFLPGLIGLALLAAAGYYGLRQARQRGMTVAGSLKQIGVEFPQDAQTTPVGHLKPAAPPLPPLPSLTELPAAGPAAAGVVTASSGGATAAVSGGGPRLVGVSGPVSGEVFLLETAAPFTVGREEGNTLALTQDNTLSRRHARVEARGGGWVVADAGSSNGTYVNGQKVEGSIAIAPGDEIQVGSARFRYEG